MRQDEPVSNLGLPRQLLQHVRLLALLALVLIASACGNRPQVVAAPPGTKQPRLNLSETRQVRGPAIAYLEDRSGDLTYAQVRQRKTKLYAKGVPHVGYSRSTWWFHIELVNDSAERAQRFLSIQWPRLNQIDVYATHANSPDERMHSGWMVPFSERKVPSPVHDFPLDFEPGERRDLWIRVKSDSELYLPLELRTPHERDYEALLSTLIGFLYYGVLIGLGLYNLVLAFRLKRLHYWLYVGQIFFYVIYMWLVSGYIGLFGWFLALGDAAVPIFSWGWLMFHIGFARSFIGTSELIPRLDRLLKLNLFIVLPLAATMTAWFLPQFEADSWLGPLIPLSLVFVLIAALICARMGSATAKWYAFAQAPLTLGFVMGSLAFSGVIDIPPALAGLMILLGTLMELVVLSVALSEHMRALAAEQAHAIRELQAGRLASLRKLVASVTHELNSPLGTLNSSVDSLVRIPSIIADTDEKRKQRALKALPAVVETVQGASRRIRKVVHSLQEFSGLDESEVQDFDVQTGLDSALDLLHGRIAPNTTLHKEYQTTPKISCHPAQLRQAFLHLLSNALEALDAKERLQLKSGDDAANGKADHARGGRELWVRTRASDTQLQIEIEDNGVGIDAARLQTIFIPELSSHGDRVKLGFGLPTSRRIIEDHGGSLELKSRLGRGTTATISLPLRTTKR